MSFVGLLQDTCTVQSKVETQSSSGEVLVTWVDKLTNLKTRMHDLNLRKPFVDGSIGLVTLGNHRFYFEIGTNITQADQIVFKGKSYQVVEVAEDSAHDHMEVAANLIHFE